MLLWNVDTSISEGFNNELVRVEMHLPVVVVMTVRTHRQDWSSEIEPQQFNIGSRTSEDIANCQQPRLKRLNVD